MAILRRELSRMIPSKTLVHSFVPFYLKKYCQAESKFNTASLFPRNNELVFVLWIRRCSHVESLGVYVVDG